MPDQIWLLYSQYKHNCLHDNYLQKLHRDAIISRQSNSCNTMAHCRCWEMWQMQLATVMWPGRKTSDQNFDCLDTIRDFYGDFSPYQDKSGLSDVNKYWYPLIKGCSVIIFMHLSNSIKGQMQKVIDIGIDNDIQKFNWQEQ